MITWFAFIESNRIESDSFLADSHQTRFRKFILLVRNDSKWFRNRFQNVSDLFVLDSFPILWPGNWWKINPIHSGSIRGINPNESKSVRTKFSIRINPNQSEVRMFQIENLVRIHSYWSMCFSVWYIWPIYLLLPTLAKSSEWNPIRLIWSYSEICFRTNSKNFLYLVWWKADKNQSD